VIIDARLASRTLVRKARNKDYAAL
jgi:hypothetical protein